jgi:hypothetical protein
MIDRNFMALFLLLEDIKNIMSHELWSNSTGDDKGSNEPVYDEDKDQLEEEQEEETREITSAITNHIF